MSHCQLGEKAAYFIHAQLVGRPTANKRLKLPHPMAGLSALPTGAWQPTCQETAQGSWGNVADARICGRSRGRSAPTSGSPDAWAPAPAPVPAAAQRLPAFLRQPAASQYVWLIPPTLGRSLARIERASGRRQAEKPPKTGLYRPAGEE